MDYKLLLEQLKMITVWLPIKNYENYEVSICGMVRNVNTKRILKPSVSNVGYYYVNLYKNIKVKKHTIHRLVGKTFIPNINNDKCIDHIDNNKLNNTIMNLRWCSYQQNSFNTSLRNNTTTGIKGVCWYKNYQKWEVKIYFNYKKIHIGYFDNLEDAKNARQKKSAELFGIYQNSCEK